MCELLIAAREAVCVYRFIVRLRNRCAQLPIIRTGERIFGSVCTTANELPIGPLERLVACVLDKFFATRCEVAMKLSNSEIVTEPIRKLLTTAEAAAYCGFKSTSAIRKAKLEGRLTPVGRRGGKGTWMWSIENLDRFLVDAPAAALGADRPGAPPIHGDVHGQQEEEQERVDETLEELGQRDPAMPEADEVRAFKWLEDERARMRSGLALVQRPSVHFGDYAVSIYEKKSAR